MGCIFSLLHVGSTIAVFIHMARHRLRVFPLSFFSFCLRSWSKPCKMLLLEGACTLPFLWRVPCRVPVLSVQVEQALLDTLRQRLEPSSSLLSLFSSSKLWVFPSDLSACTGGASPARRSAYPGVHGAAKDTKRDVWPQCAINEPDDEHGQRLLCAARQHLHVRAQRLICMRV